MLLAAYDVATSGGVVFLQAVGGIDAGGGR
jgi:hypothetical protein